MMVSYCCCGCSTFQALCYAWRLRTDLSHHLCQWSYLFIKNDGHWCDAMDLHILFFINTNRSSRDKSGCCSSEGPDSTHLHPDRRFHSLSSSTRVHDFHSTHTISMIRFVWLLRLMCWIVVFLSKSSPNAWAPMSPIALSVNFHSCWRCFLSTIQFIKSFVLTDDVNVLDCWVPPHELTKRLCTTLSKSIVCEVPTFKLVRHFTKQKIVLTVQVNPLDCGVPLEELTKCLSSHIPNSVVCSSIMCWLCVSQASIIGAMIGLYLENGALSVMCL